MTATYQFLVDWDHDGSLLIGDFEQGTDGWSPSATITTVPTRERSTDRAWHGVGSLLVTWSAWMSGSVQLVQPVPMDGFTIGADYTMLARAWVPSTNGAHVLCAIAGLSLGAASSVTGQWEEISLDFTATDATHLPQVWVAGQPAGGEQTYIDFIRIIGPGEDITDRVLAADNVNIQYGRDQARSLAPMASGQANLEVDNTSRDYSPENSASPLAGNLGPGRPVRAEAVLGERAYTLFAGHLDGYDLNPSSVALSTVSFSALDSIAALQATELSTELYPVVRTGQAIHRILDAIGWTAGRDIDPGATVIQWWWEDQTDALAAVKRIVASEGPGALATIGGSGEFMFRDRHHRLIRDASITSQATWRDTGTQPTFSGLRYDIGWRDIVNTVEIRVTERQIQLGQTVWEDDSFFTIAPGETIARHVTFDDPVWAIAQPDQGSGDQDIVNPTGSVVQAQLSRTSGQSLTLSMSVSPDAPNPAEVQRVRLRGFPVTTARTLMVTAEDTTSIARNGRRAHRPDTPWMGRNDAEAVADLILAHRAERLAIVDVTLKGSNDTRLTEQLGRDLSDRVTIVESDTGLNDSFYVDQIQHSITEGGAFHVTTFGCEKVPTLPGNVFRFDVAGAGFDDGVFADRGLDDPATVFVLDDATKGELNARMLAH